MSDSLISITANTTGSGVKVAAPDGIRQERYFATIFTYGNLGGGTVSYFISPDNGVTLVPAKTDAGVAYTTAAADSFNISLGFSNSLSAKITIYAQLTGASNPSVNIAVFDNR